MTEVAQDRFYYNALIQNTEQARTSLLWRPATFAESRVVPLLPETTNWRVAVAKVSTFGATAELPLYEAILLPGSLTATPYSFTISGSDAGSTYASSRQVVQWFPQHVVDPDKYWTASTYQHMCNVFNVALSAAHSAVDNLMSTVGAGAALNPNPPRLSWNGDGFTLTLSPIYVPGLVGSRIYNIYQNSACAALFPFPFSVSYDIDRPSVRGLDATVLMDTVVSTPVYDQTGTITGATLDQEWNATAAWSPYVALTLVATSIPVAPEFVGVTTVTAGGDINATLGGNSHTVLADIDLHGSSAHDLLTGIMYTPELMHFTPMQHGRLGGINFTCLLRRRDGTYDEWDVPSYGTIDIKLLFEYGKP